jgi:RNA polymerase sigma factor (sigma-70 family)
MKLKQTKNENLSDTELVGLLRLGNQAAFAEIYLRYQPLLYSYAYRRLQDKKKAMGVVRDVYVNLWKTKENFPIVTSLSGYLFKATLSKVLSFIFRHKQGASFDEVMHHTFSTDYFIREKEISEIIEREINALPGKMREVFLLKHKQRLCNKQIGI